MARGSASYETGQKDVTSAASLLVPARPGRITIVISPAGSSDYCVGKAGVTMTTGLYIPAGAPCTVDTAAAAQPTSFKVIAWQRDGQGLYTGCIIRVWKSQTIPQNLATLLLGGVFNLFAASVVGTRFSLIALARSDTQ